MEPNKGIKSTEFWTVLGTSVFSVLNQFGVIGIPLPVDLLHWLIGAAASYVISRTAVKTVATVSAAKVEIAATNTSTK